MSDLLLQTIVEKLEALEIALLKPVDDVTKSADQLLVTNQIKTYQSEIKQYAVDLRNQTTKLELLLTKSTAFSSAPVVRLDKTIHHHHLHKGLWISIGLFLLLTILAMGLINTMNDLKVYEANDIKYRQLKVTADTSMLKKLYNLDSLFHSNADAFIKHTIEEEDRIAERARLFQLAGEKEREARELLKKAQRF